MYSRKSKYTGKGESVGNQVEMCKKRLQYRYENLDLENEVVIYEDEGFTGYNTKRPNFQRMLKDIKDNKIKCVICYRLDRISRNVSDFAEFKETFSQYDVTFISISEDFDTSTPMGNAMMMIASVFAQLERDTIAERIRDNMLELAKTGRWLGGNTPTGFKSKEVQKMTIDGKKKKLFRLTPIIEEVNVVKTIYDKYLHLKSQSSLETYMLKNDIKTKNGKHFSRWSLVNILTNPVYAVADKDTLEYFKQFDIEIFADEKDFDGTHGLMVYNKTEKKGKTNHVIKKDVSEWIVAIGKHKGVISGKNWVEVQRLLDKNADKRYRKPAGNNALLSGLLKCSYCGFFMRPKLKGKNDLDSKGNRKFDYMCSLKDKSRKTKCNCMNINGIEADNLVMQTIKDLFNPNHEFYMAIKTLLKSFDIAYDNNHELNLLKAEYKKNQSNINNLLDRIKYVDVSLINNISAEIKKLKNTNMEIEKQMKALTKDKNNFISDKEITSLALNILDTYFNTFDFLDLVHKRDLIKSLVSSVTSNGKDININLVGSEALNNNSIIPRCDSSK
ncbi:MAG: recombinase family protein [Bacilli bacterium]|nr:recombinase family protein [Bacilli bacterium]